MNLFNHVTFPSIFWKSFIQHISWRPRVQESFKWTFASSDEFWIHHEMSCCTQRKRPSPLISAIWFKFCIHIFSHRIMFYKWSAFECVHLKHYNICFQCHYENSVIWKGRSCLFALTLCLTPIMLWHFNTSTLLWEKKVYCINWKQEL